MSDERVKGRATELADAVAPAERLLEDRFGGRVAIVEAERVDPWCIARVCLEWAAPSPGLPDTAMVKWLRDHPADRHSREGRMVTEDSALRWLESAVPGLAPRPLGLDAEAAVLVVEDLTPRQTLWNLLAADDDDATSGLHSFARSLARLHVSTSGRAAEYDARRGLTAGFDPGAERRRLFCSTWSWELPDLGPLGVAPTPRALVEMSSVRADIDAPGPFLALSNGDAGANNFMVDGSDGRVIDWEFGCLRHALVDASCLHVPGPVWMTVADPGPIGVADTYRRALAEVISAAEGDEYERALAGACVATAAERLGRFVRLDRRPPGHHSRAQAVSTVESAARAVRACGPVLPDLLGWLDDVSAALRRRWPDADREYPDAYTRRDPPPPASAERPTTPGG